MMVKVLNRHLSPRQMQFNPRCGVLKHPAVSAGRPVSGVQDLTLLLRHSGQRLQYADVA